MRRVSIAAVAAAVVAAVVAFVGLAPADESATSAKKGQRKVIARNLDVPWGIDFLPSGAALVAERSTGRILKVPRRGGRAKQVMRVPGVDRNAGEGGLLGLAVSPRYRKDKRVYAYLTTKRDNRIVRFKLGGKLDPILTGIRESTVHNGGRIEFGPDGRLYAGVGDAGNAELSQRKRSKNGKVLRINPNGSIPKGNPFGRRSPVFSLGHRNVQGLAWDRRGRLWATEFGGDRRDEVNLIRKGNNYGWPLVEGRGGTRGGKFTNPKVTWSPAQASPSGAAIRGKTLFVAALRGERLWQIRLKGKNAGRPRARLKGRYGRLRTVEVAPGGPLWIATSNENGNDRIIQLGRR